MISCCDVHLVVCLSMDTSDPENIISGQLTPILNILCLCNYFFKNVFSLLLFWCFWMFHTILSTFSDSGQNLFHPYIFMHTAVSEAKRDTTLPSILVIWLGCRTFTSKASAFFIKNHRGDTFHKSMEGKYFFTAFTDKT